MFKLVLEKAEEPEIKLPTSAGSWKKQESKGPEAGSACKSEEPWGGQWAEAQAVEGTGGRKGSSVWSIDWREWKLGEGWCHDPGQPGGRGSWPEPQWCLWRVRSGWILALF